MTASPLLDHTIWWHVYPLGATGAPIRGHRDSVPRLRKLVAWLDYAIELGCSGILLGPIFESSTHGYDTLDHLRIDSRLGDDEDWDHFVGEARSRGLHVMLDGVFNHVGIDHPLVAAAVDGGGLVKVRDGRPVDWEGNGDLAELDHSDPRTADLVTEVMLHWLRRGASGWRLDVAYAVPSEFWAEVIGRVKQEFPDALFLGEVIHGDYAALARDGALDSITQYELWKAIWSSIKDENFWELAWTLDRHEAFSREFVTNTFVGNHDVSRIASIVGDDGAALAAIMLFTLPGMPSIYYGDEHGFRGEKGESFEADDALRPELPDAPPELADVGQWLFHLYQGLVSLRRRNPWLVHGSVAVEDKSELTIRYSVTGEGHRLEASIALEPKALATVTIDGVDVFGWGAEAS